MITSLLSPLLRIMKPWQHVSLGVWCLLFVTVAGCHFTVHCVSLWLLDCVQHLSFWIVSTAAIHLHESTQHVVLFSGHPPFTPPPHLLSVILWSMPPNGCHL